MSDYDHFIYNLKTKITVSFIKKIRELSVNLTTLAVFCNNSSENYCTEIPKNGKDAAR